MGHRTSMRQPGKFSATMTNYLVSIGMGSNEKGGVVHTRREGGGPKRTGLSGRPSVSRDADSPSQDKSESAVNKQSVRTYPNRMELIPKMLKHFVHDTIH